MQKKIRTNSIMTTLIAVALLLLAAPAMAEPATPFVLDGYVTDSNGDPCNNPWVQVTNTGSWDAKNDSASNYYQLVLDSDDVSEDDVLAIEASGCSQSKIVSETVSQDEIDGGGSGLNIVLRPIITSCDTYGNGKNEFYPGENVSVMGTGLAPSTGYTIWIQDDPVDEGDSLPTSTDPSGSQELVETGVNGSFGPIEIWSNIPAGPRMNYDIVADKQGDGADTGKYNEASDGIDSTNGVVGIVAPIPELASTVLFAVGLVTLLGCMRLGRRD